MEKEQLEQHKNLGEDLLLWIKYFLCVKVGHLGVQKGYSDNENEAEEMHLKYFNRQFWEKNIMSASSCVDLHTVTNQIQRNGLKSLENFSTPLLKLHWHLVLGSKLKSIKDINTEFINWYVKQVLGIYSEWTQKNYYIQIKSLFSFIDKYSLSSDNFIFDIGIAPIGKRAKSPAKSIPSKSMQYLEPNEFVEFIEFIKSSVNNHPVRAQPKLLLKILSFTGLRVSELKNIKIDDVSVKEMDLEKYLKINTENNYVLVPYEFIKEEYEIELFCREEYTNISEVPYLFYNRDRKQYLDITLRDLIRRFLKKAQITQSLDGRSFGRSYAIYQFSKGISKEKVLMQLRYLDKETLDFCILAAEKSSESNKKLDEII